MLNNFIYAQTKDLFLEQLGAGNILDEAIVFIEDTKEIWNHGTYFGRESDFDADVFAALQQAVLDLQNATADINTDLDKKLDKTTAESTYATKNELPSLNGYLTEETAATIYATISQINAINQNVEHLSSIIVESGDGTKFLSDDGTYKFVETNPFEIPANGVLPETGKVGKIYLIPASVTGENNIMHEYVWANDAWEKLGEFKADVDLSGYYTKEEIDSSIETITSELEEIDNVTAAALTDLDQRIIDMESTSATNDAQVLSDAKSYVDDKETALRDDLTLMQASIDSKLDISVANNTYATKNAINGKQDELVSGQNIKTLNGTSILGTGDIVIDTSVLDSLGDSSERPLSQKAATDAINSEIERATDVEANLLNRIESHEAITQQAAQDASEANAYAQAAYTQSTEAVNTANVAKNAVATLEGLANTDTAQQTLAATVAQIEQNTNDINVLKEKFVVLSETEYTAIELKDPDKIYLVYEE